MSAISSNRLLVRLTASYLLAALLVSIFPTTIFAQSAISADIKANGSDGTVTINNGESWNYSWTSSVATACQLNSPSGVSGITLAGNDGPISPGHPWYPAVGGSTTLTLTCTDGTNTANDSVTITIASSGGGGGGGGSVTADIKANNSDGTVTIANGASWNYSWTSSSATACQLTSPSGTSGITLAGNDGPIQPGHPWYPAVGGSTTLTLTCTDGTTTATDSVTVTIAGGGGGGGGTAITADIKINGQDGTVTISNGTSWNYSWNSTGATACQLTSPSGVSGITLAGNDGPISTGHPWYPAVGGSTTLTFTCTDGTNTATDSATVRIGGAITADIKINGQDGTVTINNGAEWNYSWTSTGATACQLTSPSGVSGITLNGNDGPIQPGHPWYPAVGGSTTLTFTCTDGTNTAVDSATVQVVQPSSGGGGGGSSSRSRGTVLPGEVLGTATVANFCPFLTTYMRVDFNNDPMQVIRLQAFLKVVEGHDYVTVNGVFDQATLRAVHAFQQKYANEVLRPWGTNQSTGYVYVLTLAKINQILCGTGMPNVTPAKQVAAPVKPVMDKEGAVIDKEGGTCPCKEGKDGGVSSGSPQLPVVGDNGSGSSTVVAGSNGQKDQKDIGRVAASIFSAPASGVELMQCIYEFLLILIVLYIIGSVLENVLYKDGPENTRKKFLTKWGVMSAGLLLSAVAAYMIGEMCLVLPLIVALILSLAWMFLYPKRDVIKEKTTTIMNRPSNQVTKVEEKRA